MDEYLNYFNEENPPCIELNERNELFIKNNP